MKHADILFDRQNSRISFAQANCTPEYNAFVEEQNSGQDPDGANEEPKGVIPDPDPSVEEPKKTDQVENNGTDNKNNETELKNSKNGIEDQNETNVPNPNITGKPGDESKSTKQDINWPAIEMWHYFVLGFIVLLLLIFLMIICMIKRKPHSQLIQVHGNVRLDLDRASKIDVHDYPQSSPSEGKLSFKSTEGYGPNELPPKDVFQLDYELDKSLDHQYNVGGNLVEEEEHEPKNGALPPNGNENLS